MPDQQVTLHIPGAIYDHLKQRAEARNRTLQEEIVETLLAAVPVPQELHGEYVAALAPLADSSDLELWNAARSRFTAEDAAELEALHHKRGRQGLTAEEERAAAVLLRRYEKTVLIRAEAAALLKQRGFDVSELLRAP